jgi:hypothetical protein
MADRQTIGKLRLPLPPVRKVNCHEALDAGTQGGNARRGPSATPTPATLRSKGDPRGAVAAAAGGDRQVPQLAIFRDLGGLAV